MELIVHWGVQMSAGIIPVKFCEGHDKGGTAAVEAHSRVSYPPSGDR